MLSSPQPSSLLHLEGADLGCLQVAGAGLRLEDEKLGQGKVQPDFVLYLKCIFEVLSSLSQLCPPHPTPWPPPRDKAFCLSDLRNRHSPRGWGPWDLRIYARGKSGRSGCLVGAGDGGAGCPTEEEGAELTAPWDVSHAGRTTQVLLGRARFY